MSVVHGICRRCSRRRYLTATNRMCERCDAKCQQEILLGLFRLMGLAS